MVEVSCCDAVSGLRPSRRNAVFRGGIFFCALKERRRALNCPPVAVSSPVFVPPAAPYLARCWRECAVWAANPRIR